MLKRLLIANRGEIARRVIRTARRLGVQTVAIYSDADAHASHVQEADFAVRLGPAPARESYLDQAKVLAAAKESGADSIHPGYGFLSENAEFAEAVTAAGLVWVGPPPSAIRAMGLKDAAKRLMQDAGVPVTPGYLGEDQSPERLASEAGAIGYPVLIKAVAGGGGKGMRRVDAPADFAAALASAKREAASSFGDDRVLIEKYVSRPRHIEVQVFADTHGNAVHLFERDCSLQRRHQKVIEEAPAPGMDEATRAAVTSAAVRAAQAVDYVGAGTVEFIADASEGLRPDRVWFMEMNTRLQVEHPVTEEVTGQDLVEWQLRIASGEPLPLTQDQIRLNGWAMEARLYAENPATGFLPSTGPLEHFELPEPGEGIRIDSGVEAGGEVTPFYDPMIAKLIAHAPNRETAAAKLAEACREVEVWPVRTNAAFLARCLAEPDFVAGQVDTGFIEARLDRLVASGSSSATVAAAIGGRLEQLGAEYRLGWVQNSTPWDAFAIPSLFGFRLNAPSSAEVSVRGPGVHSGIKVAKASAGNWKVAVGAQTHLVDDEVTYWEGVRVDGRTIPVLLHLPDQVVVFESGEALDYHFGPTAAEAGEAAGGSGQLTAPMPGRIVSVSAKSGETVKKGQPVVTLEAMKMEHGLVAPFDGKVVEISAKVGDQVSEGTVLARLEAE